MPEQIKLTIRARSGKLYRHDATIETRAGRIWFLKSPFAAKDEIKAMKGSRWHPANPDPEDADDGNPRKCWSVEDCPRNRFQLAYLTGEDVYEWFDRDVIKHEYKELTCNGKPAEIMLHQCDLSDHGLTYHYGIWASEMGTGKTLAAQQVIEKSGVKSWWWVGPKTSLPNIRREFRKWGFNFDGDIEVEFMTYEQLVRRMDEYKPGDPIPQGVFFDESSKCKGATSQRTRAAQMLADLIRAKYGFDGYCIEMSGTPGPKSPIDWWAQCEIAWPGFLREGSPKALEQRLAFLVDQQFDAGVFKKRKGWRDDEHKCAVCGEYELLGPHELDGETEPDDYHKFEPSVNEVAFMYERLKGLVIVKHLKDCIDLPAKRYRKVICKPSSSILRVAKAISDSAPNVITGMSWLRELSDGFQYKSVKDGKIACSHCPDHLGKVFEWFRDGKTYKNIDALEGDFERREVDCPRCKGSGEMDKMVRQTREVPCPKDKALLADLERCEETGRIVVFAGFTGSIDRIAKLCRKEGWSVVRCDGRGWEVSVMDGKDVRVITTDGEAALEYWADLDANPRVAFVAHPESGGMSLTLTESRMVVFYSNSFKPEYRSQSEARVYRKGMNERLGCEIVDYVHLPTDNRVIEVIQENRRLELMSMGELATFEDVPVGNDDIVLQD